MKIYLIIIFLTTFQLINSNYVLGCSYLFYTNPPDYYRFVNTEYVFIGTAIEKNIAKKKVEDREYLILKVKFAVHKDYKYNLKEFIELKYSQPVLTSSCTLLIPEIELHKTYIVSHNIDDNYSRFYYDLTEKSVDDDFSVQNNLDILSKRNNKVIFGEIIRQDLKNFIHHNPQKDIKIVLESKKYKSETLTDKGGNFSFEVPRNGKYKIRFLLDFAGKDFMTKETTKPLEESGKYLFEYEVDLTTENVEYRHLFFVDVPKD